MTTRTTPCWKRRSPIDFVNAALGAGRRVAVELTLQSAKELSGALARAIAAAEIEESARVRQV